MSPVTGTFSKFVPAKIVLQSIGIDERRIFDRSVGEMPSKPELATGLFGTGEFGTGLFGTGEFGTGLFGTGAAPTAEFGTGLFGTGAKANCPSTAAGTDESGTFAAPAGADASSAVSARPTFGAGPVAVTQPESSEVLPESSVAVAVIASPADTGAVIPLPVSIEPVLVATLTSAHPIQRAPSPLPLASHAGLS